MSDVINRKTKQILYSVHTPDYQEPEWMIINNKHIPIQPSKYWKIINNEVLEMTKQEKAIIDYVEPTPKPKPTLKVYSFEEKIDSILSVLLEKYPTNPTLQELQNPVQIEPSTCFAISYEE